MRVSVRKFGKQEFKIGSRGQELTLEEADSAHVYLIRVFLQCKISPALD